MNLHKILTRYGTTLRISIAQISRVSETKCLSNEGFANLRIRYQIANLLHMVSSLSVCRLAFDAVIIVLVLSGTVETPPTPAPTHKIVSETLLLLTAVRFGRHVRQT